MQWLELTIKTRSEAIDLLEAELTLWGFDSFIIDDSVDFHNFLETNRAYWDYVDEELAQRMANVSQLRLYLADDAAAMETVSYLRQQLALLPAQYPAVDFGTLRVQLESVRDEDWENNWKQYYKPLPVGERLLVVPQWLHPENPEGRLPILLDPGMIFGTGAHASTQMCMKELERLVHGGEAVLDLGSGSGILSICALLLGAKTAVGVDIDPKAEDIARENAAINGLHADRFTALSGDVIGDADTMRRLAAVKYDIVCANIVADVIIPMARVVPQLLKQDATFLCSGILAQREAEVAEAISAAGLRIVGREQMDDWCRLSAKLA